MTNNNYPNQGINSTLVKLAAIRKNFGVVQKVYKSTRQMATAEKDEKTIMGIRQQIDEVYEKGY